MTLLISLNTLQYYWWFILSLLGSILVFMLFVQGGQTLLYTLAKNEDERSLLVNSLGRKWELTFTMLVVFGGTAFASFPLFYSTSFGGAYWAWMILLFCFVIQAVAYEYRSKPDNFLGKRTYETFLFINGAMGTFLLGVVVASFFTGSEFSVDYYNISNAADPAVSRWENKLHGIELLFNMWNLVLGLCIFFLSRVLAILYFMNNVRNDNILNRAKKHLLINAVPFVLLFVVFVIYVLLKDGLGGDPASGLIYLEEKRYLGNFLQMPVLLVVFLTGVLLVLSGIAIAVFKKPSGGIWYSGIGVILTVLALLCVAGFNNTPFYPSLTDMQSSLTIQNASSSYYTLSVMTYVSVFIPVVAAYITYAWYRMNHKPIDGDELNSENHVY